MSDHEQGHTTTFEVRTLYDTFEATALLRSGPNALGCTIARGWFGEGGGPTMTDYYHGRSLMLKLSLHYHNGSRAAVVSSAKRGGV